MTDTQKRAYLVSIRAAAELKAFQQVMVWLEKYPSVVVTQKLRARQAQLQGVYTVAESVLREPHA